MTDNIKFHRRPSSGNRVVSVRTYGRTDERTDITKLTVVFHNFANATKTFFTSARQLVFLQLYLAYQHLQY